MLPLGAVPAEMPVSVAVPLPNRLLNQLNTCPPAPPPAPPPLTFTSAALTVIVPTMLPSTLWKIPGIVPRPLAALPSCPAAPA